MLSYTAVVVHSGAGVGIYYIYIYRHLRYHITLFLALTLTVYVCVYVSVCIKSRGPACEHRRGLISLLRFAFHNMYICMYI